MVRGVALKKGVRELITGFLQEFRLVGHTGSRLNSPRICRTDSRGVMEGEATYREKVLVTAGARKHLILVCARVHKTSPGNFWEISDNGLGAVAVVHIKVDDCHPLNG